MRGLKFKAPKQTVTNWITLNQMKADSDKLDHPQPDQNRQ